MSDNAGIAKTETMTAPAADGTRINWQYGPWIFLVHVLALLAFLPWFFSWTGVVLAVLGLYVFGTLGMNVGYHRLLTHNGLKCPRWLEYTLAIFGVCCAQDSPSVWVAIHRRHHQFSDEEADPHSPIKGFLWGHFGWLMVKKPDMKYGPLVEKYAKDLQRDPFYAWLERSDNWIKVGLVSWIVFFGAGFVAAIAMGSDRYEAFQFGMSLLVWGAFVRLVAVWHLTWSVNSVSHLWGYRNYETPDLSRNNVFVGFLASGEGWHNNHHADPRSARHGHKWWEFDLSWLTIRLLMALGLAKNVALPSPILAAKYAAAGRRIAPAADYGDDVSLAPHPLPDAKASAPTASK